MDTSKKLKVKFKCFNYIKARPLFWNNDVLNFVVERTKLKKNICDKLLHDSKN